MKPAPQSSVQIHDELKRREAGVGRPPRGRVRRTSRPTTSTSSTTTAAATATAPRLASGAALPRLPEATSAPAEDERKRPAPLLAPSIDTLVSAEGWGWKRNEDD